MFYAGYVSLYCASITQKRLGVSKAGVALRFAMECKEKHEGEWKAFRIAFNRDRVGSGDDLIAPHGPTEEAFDNDFHVMEARRDREILGDRKSMKKAARKKQSNGVAEPLALSPHENAISKVRYRTFLLLLVSASVSVTVPRPSSTFGVRTFGLFTAYHDVFAATESRRCRFRGACVAKAVASMC